MRPVAESPAPVGENGPVTIGPNLTTSIRRRAVAVLAAVAAAAAGVLITLNPTAAAAAPGSLAVAQAPVTTTVGKASLSADPARGLSSAGGPIKIDGNGFTGTGGLYVAVCHADDKAPKSLADCVGGAIPDSNATKSWGLISTDGSAPATGGVGAKWFSGGAFTITLTLPGSNSASDALDCSKVACAVYTRVAGNGPDDPTQDLSIPLTYEAATSSSAPISSQQSTSTLAGVGTTVQPKLVRAASVVAGGAQEVLFAGFAKGESVAVTLYSAPRSLPAVKADADGVVKIDFTVPADLPAGTHLLRAVGATSKVTGVASFQVTAPVASSAESSSVASSTAVSSAPVSSAAVPPISLSPVSTSSSAPATSVAPAVTPPATSGSRPVWPWYLLGIVLLAWIGFAVFMLQRRRQRMAADMLEKDRLLAEGALAEQQRGADAIALANSDAPTSYLGPRAPEQPGGYAGYHPGEHGLLSGRDNPENPGLLSGGGYRPGSTADQPTTYLPPATPGTGGQPGPGSVAEGGAPTGYGGAPTGSWTPDFTAGPPGGAEPPEAGQGTAQWRPDFGDTGPQAEPDDRPDDAGSNEGGRHSR